MMAITIWQPWASLILAGAKPWEWRFWPAPRRLWGQRIAIHAGARPMRRDELSAMIYEISTGIDNHTMIPAIAIPILERALSLPRSAILGTAILGEPIRGVEWAKQQRPVVDPGSVSALAWAWPLTGIEAIEPPAMISGSQGFWRWDTGP